MAIIKKSYGYAHSIFSYPKSTSTGTNNKSRKKLEACEKKHDEANAQIGHLREDCGLLKGRVQALEMITDLNYRRQERPAS
jgi:hypothetical protein